MRIRLSALVLIAIVASSPSLARADEFWRRLETLCGADDYILVQLDGPAVARRFAASWPTRLPTSTDTMTALGHPLGLPLIASENGRLLPDSTHTRFLYTTLDSYPGDSGGPVFTDADHALVGIVIRGAHGLVARDDGACDEDPQNGELAQPGTTVLRADRFLADLRTHAGWTN